MLFCGKSLGNSLRKFFTAVALLSILVLPATASVVLPSPATFGWNPSTDPTAVGYLLSYGPSSTSLDDEIDAGASTTVEVLGLAPGQTNYFVVASYNAQGIVGAPSGMVAYAVPTGSISQQPGGLEVSLNLVGGQWAIDGGAWQDSGAIVSGVTVGSHTVTFSAVTGWTAPANEMVTISADQTNSIIASYFLAAQTGGLQVTLNVAGAQWSVDGGVMQASGAIVTGLSVGSHTVTFGAVSGWVTPASQTISIVPNQTSSISATYVAASQVGGLTVTLNATGAQWSVDGGAWQNSGVTVSGLATGSHTVSFSAVSGWTTPANQAVTIVASQTDSLSVTYVAIQTGSLRVTLNVSGAQWNVDNGSWQKSGATISGLSFGTHTVSFNSVSGYTTPASQTVSITATKTKSVSATYVAVVTSTGSLLVTLNLAGAQWSVDTGAWQNSGATVSGLSIGSHTITFTDVIGWTTPASQTISIVANQTASATATYVAAPQSGSLHVTLNAPGAQWSVDAGALQNSGATDAGLSVGSHTITFTTVTGWTTPASQTISIVANQTATVTATYIAVPQTGSLQVTLNAPGAHWSVDAGALQNSGATVAGLSVGSHTITFTTVTGWTTPASQTVSIVVNQTASVAATYVAIPPTGSLQVTLNAPGAQWSVDNGLLQNTGTIVSNLSVGSHTINFSTISGWTTPASQMVSIVANQTNLVTATYIAITQTGALQATLTPAVAQWSVDSGAWQNSGAIVAGLSVGSHSVTFSAVSGWTKPAKQSVTIVANQTTSITATYIAVPQTGSVQVTTSPAAAQWSVDNGSLQISGTVVSGLSVGSHTIAFSAMSGWTTPVSQTISVVANQTTAVSATYVAVPQTGALAVTLSPAVGQFSVDSGVWQNSGAIVAGLSVGSHSVTFSAVSGWTTPANQTVSIVANQTNSITATYVAVTQTGSLQVTLNVPGAQWSVDNGLSQNSGATVSGLSIGSHTITFTAVTGWTTPASQAVSIVANQTAAVSATYVAVPQTGALEVTLSPAVAQWSVDSGVWQNSGAIVAGLSVGSHTVTFSAMTGWTTPTSQTVSIVANQTNSIAATYVAVTQTGSLQVTLNAPGAQWSIDNGLMQTSGAIVSGLSVGSHTIAFSAVSGWTTPVSQTVLIVANQTAAVSATYAVIPQTGALEVTLSPAVAQWSVDSGVWQNSGAIVAGLSVGSHTVTFSAMSGWTTPTSQTVSIVANQTNSITATYVAITQTGSLRVTLNVPGAQWSVDNGLMQNSGVTISGLSVGSHTITFTAVTGWTTPASQTVSIVANQTAAVTATYVAVPQTGSLQVTLNAPGAQWSVDSGAWQNSGAIVAGLSVGSHTVAFSAMSGWTTPASQTVSVVANQTAAVTATYVAIPQTGALQVTLNAPGAQWSVDNGLMQTSGAIVPGLSVGSHTIAFSAVSGWTTPASQTVSIVANQTAAVTATYVAIPTTGALEVTLNPSVAQWSVDSGIWQNSGAIVASLSPGSHTVTFNAVSGWAKPAKQTITIVVNQTNAITATYIAIPQTGVVEVTTTPATGQWSIDNGSWQSSGAVVSGLSVGSHTITFNALSGWTTPANQTISVVANQTTPIAATYLTLESGGALQVSMSPTNAQWSVDNGVLQNSSATVVGLSVGSHTVSFSAMAGWMRPFSQTVSIVANQTNSITAAYVAIPETGALQVNVSPAAAQWCVDNGSWQNSGAIVSMLSIGSHTIVFGAVNGYAAPAPRTITIVGNETNVVAVTYKNTTEMGALLVTLNVPGAQWAVDGGYWQESGHGVPGLSVGSHTVTFSVMSNWFAPSNMVVSIVANQTNLVTATYVAISKPGSLQVTLNPAVTQWAVDNGSWQNSGATVSALLPGSHTVSFSLLSGWTAPSNQTVIIVAGQTSSISAAYVAISKNQAGVGPSGTILARGNVTQSGLQKKQAASASVSPSQRNSAGNFEPKRMVEMAGTYNGLFYPAKGVTQETSGMLSGLVVNSNGAYSGRILLHGSTLPVSGTFDAAGHSCQFLQRSRRLGGPVIVDMTLSWNGDQPGILGTVSGSDAAPWTANLIADFASTNQMSYQSTILFPPAANAPAGFGSATILNEGGSAMIVGKLANGKRFSQHVTVSADGSAPFYVYLGANEVVFGWVMNLYSAKPGGEIAWIKGTAHMQRNFNEGFTSLIAATGSSRTLAAPDQTPIDLAGVMEQSSRDAQTQMAKIFKNASTSMASVSPNDF